MADIMVALKCPRRAAMSMGGGVHKTAVLRSVAKEVAMSIAKEDFATTKAQIKKRVKEGLAARGHNMLPFEAASEQERMVTSLDAMAIFERTQHHKVVAMDFEERLPFGTHADGKPRTKHCHVDVLIERCGALESIRYVYKLDPYYKPGYYTRAKGKDELRPDSSAELLLLQMAGEAQAKRLGYDIDKTPVFGSIHFLRLRSKMTGGVTKQMGFEETEGDNIAAYHFGPTQRDAIIDRCQHVYADTAKVCCDPSYCRTCACDELCHLEFVKRSLVVLPEEPPIPINDVHMTEAQRNFVEFRRGECRVDAVAGSGKTTIIVLRTLGLLEEGVKPEQILMITFTDKAAAEMRQRLTAYASGAALADEGLDVSKVEVSTFNAWGQHILDQYYGQLGFSAKPELIDDVTKKDVIISILRRHTDLPLDYNNPFMSTYSHTGAVIQTMAVIDAMKSAHVSTVPEAEAAIRMTDVTLASRAPEFLDIYREYNDELVRKNLLDYEDQLRLLLDLDRLGLFAKMPYAHIVIDEFQDSNPNQMDIIRRMVAQLPNYQSVAVVGDVMQSIYSFRYATPENLEKFNEFFPAMVDISMTDNFRSYTPIVKLANHLIQKASSASEVKATIVAHKLGHALDPVLMKVEDADRETALFIAQTKKLIRDGVEPSDIAVLCRTRGELVRLRDAMAEAGIPVIMRVPEIVGDAPYVRAVIALAKFLEHDDRISLALYAKSLGLDPFDAAQLDKLGTEITDRMNALTKEKAKVDLFFELLKDAEQDFMAAQFLEEVRARHFRTLKRTLGYIVKYERYGTRELHSTAHERSNSVTLITIHSAKGLEWPIVLLSTKGFRTKVGITQAETEEEQRLLYVAITRAKEKLLVTYTPKQQRLMELLQ